MCCLCVQRNEYSEHKVLSFLQLPSLPQSKKRLMHPSFRAPSKGWGWCSFICGWGNTSKYGKQAASEMICRPLTKGHSSVEIIIHIFPNLGGGVPYFYPSFGVTNRQLGWLEFALGAPNSSSPSIELDFELRHLWLQCYQSGIGLVSYLGKFSDMKGVS